MKRFLILIFLITITFVFLQAQEINLLDIEIDLLDSLFDEPSSLNEDQQQQEKPNEPTIISNIRRRGIDLSVSYNFRGAANPGWDAYPWDLKGEEEFSWAFGIEMSSTLDLNAQISEVFRVKSVISYAIPGNTFVLGNFFFDYNFFDKVFFRGGKYEQGWGISPNFGFTNLLARIATQMQGSNPELPNYDEYAVSTDGTSYLLKFDVPIGIGGVQLLALTRANLAAGVFPYNNFIGYGGKINLAYKWADFNLGLFYQKYMATRAFLSVKTNLFKTDIYSEYLIGINNHTDNSVGFGINIGFTRSFFENKLEVNGEYYYNGEERSYYYRPETDFFLEETLPFLEKHNFALNILYRFGGKINLRIFTKFIYGDDSFSLMPGFTINPFSGIEFYFAVPVAFGDGYYYNNSKNYRGDLRPLSVLLYINFGGSVRARHYY